MYLVTYDMGSSFFCFMQRHAQRVKYLEVGKCDNYSKIDQAVKILG